MIHQESVSYSELQHMAIQWDNRTRSLTIKGKKVSLTRTEYSLLLPLRYGLPVTYNALSTIVYQCPVDEHICIMLDKHIDRIRIKLRGTGMYIHCVLGYGYIFFPKNDHGI